MSFSLRNLSAHLEMKKSLYQSDRPTGLSAKPELAANRRLYLVKLRLMHFTDAVILKSLLGPGPGSHLGQFKQRQERDCKSGHSGRWEILTAMILPEQFLTCASVVLFK